jgi:hypothetical protein
MSDAAVLTADELLDMARDAYRQGCANYRDALLESGRLLHEFVLCFLQTGTEMTEWNRTNAGITRCNALKIAAEKLKVTPARVNNLIATWAVGDLLGEGDLGDLGIAAIYRFKVFIRRGRGHRGKKGKGRVIVGRKDGPPVTELERYEVKPRFAESAKALFQQAVAAGFTQLQAREECNRLFSVEESPYRHSNGLRPRVAPQEAAEPKKRQPVHRRNECGAEVDSGISHLQRAAAVASPGDVAEMCISLIEKAEDPKAVAVRLRVMLERFLAPKRKAVFI